MTDVTVILATVTATVAVVSALTGLVAYVRFRTKSEKKAAIGQAFTAVVSGLSSQDVVQQLSNAILLRRFFDPHSEYATAGMPYAVEARTVIAAVLRTLPGGQLQKILADGLAHAPSLAGADLQDVNLRNAYLGSVNVCGADFFRADLSYASLKGARAERAVFYQSQLVATVFSDADLRRADLYAADVKQARFDGALLAGARFAGAQNIPPHIAQRLNPEGVFQAREDERLVPPVDETTSPGRPRVFLSTPNLIAAPQRALAEVVVSILKEQNVMVERIARPYSAVAPLREVARTVRNCRGAVILCIPQLEVTSGRWRAGTTEERVLEHVRFPTAWNQVEAGMAVALGLPLFIISDRTIGGVLDLEAGSDDIVRFALDDTWDLDRLRASVREWLKALDDS